MKQPPKNGSKTENDNKTQKSAQIRAEALANARKAREALGEETIQKLAYALKKMQQSPTEQAKAKIARQDAAKVAERIIEMLDE
jgi:hypothetical protein